MADSEEETKEDSRAARRVQPEEDLGWHYYYDLASMVVDRVQDPLRLCDGPPNPDALCLYMDDQVEKAKGEAVPSVIKEAVRANSVAQRKVVKKLVKTYRKVESLLRLYKPITAQGTEYVRRRIEQHQRRFRALWEIYLCDYRSSPALEQALAVRQTYRGAEISLMEALPFSLPYIKKE